MNKTALLNTLLLSTVVLLSACQKKPAPTDAPEDEAVTTPVTAAKENTRLKVKTVKADYILPACEGEACPEVSVQRIDTNHAWLTQYMDSEIQHISNIQSSEELGDNTTLQHNIDALLLAAAEDGAERGEPVPYVMDVEASYLGQHKQLVLFEISAGFYTGGAHGSAVQNFYNLDLVAQHKLTLDDIVFKGKRAALYDLVYAQFEQWLTENDPEADVDAYEKTWPFQLTDNFLFDKTGLKFSYAQYEIAPYSAGMPNFVVPYAQLAGIIKPDYL